jgi:hypothetical protein
VYVTGGYDANSNATCWKNETALTLASGSGPSFAASVVVNGSDVYVVGDQQNSSTG